MQLNYELVFLAGVDIFFGVFWQDGNDIVAGRPWLRSGGVAVTSSRKITRNESQPYFFFNSYL